jgi:hypothetical protein
MIRMAMGQPDKLGGEDGFFLLVRNFERQAPAAKISGFAHPRIGRQN